jgi:hypothetical protein
MSKTRKYFVVQVDDEEKAESLEVLLHANALSYIIQPSTPVELRHTSEGWAPVLWHDDKVVVRGHWQKGEFHLVTNEVIDGVERLPRGYMLGNRALHHKPSTK